MRQPPRWRWPRTAAAWVLVGWLWYLVLAGAGHRAGAGRGCRRWADRYTYIPLTGIFLVCAWSLRELALRRPRLRAPVVAACLAGLLALASATWVQSGHWRSNAALFGHAVAIRPDNWIALNNLGNALLDQGRIA